MKIDIGNYVDAVKEDEDSKIPMNGQFEFQITSLPEMGETAKGDSKMVFELSVINCSDPVFSSKVNQYHAKVPSLGFTRIIRALGIEWDGTSMDTDEIASTAYNKIIKATCTQKTVDDFINYKFLY